jgi:Tfp pilus assembly protein PilF
MIAMRICVLLGCLAAGGCGPTPDPDASAAAIERGVAKIGAGRLDQALVDLAESVSLDPDSTRARLTYGAALERSDRLDAAGEQYRAAARIAPDDASARLHLERIDDLRELDRRIADAKSEIATRPADPSLHTRVGELLHARRRWADAQKYFFRALRLDPSLAAAHAGLGISLVAGRREARALHHLARAIELDPQLTAARDELVWVLATSGDETLHDPTTAIARAELASGPNQRAASPRLLDALAAAFASNGRFEEARATALAGRRAARQAGDHLLAAGIDRRIEGYAAGKPYRIPRPASSGSR